MEFLLYHLHSAYTHSILEGLCGVEVERKIQKHCAWVNFQLCHLPALRPGADYLSSFICIVGIIVVPAKAEIN